ncbi:MAG: hypothetical protein JW715_11055 [Sedimentisphaerales bacterium]|nr:hypothetical protein [Sedimentisphaerales bacterium]
MDTKDQAQFRFRWPLVVILGVFFASIIIFRFSYSLSAIKADTAKTVIHYSNPPITKEANQVDSLDLEQKQDTPTPVVAEAAPRIEAICISIRGKSCIFVQGNPAYEGDVVDGFKIIKIYPDKVEFEKDGKTITASFPRP